jgi:hypothetical protein
MKEIIGFEGYFVADNEVFSNKSGVLIKLKKTITNQGYLKVSLHKNKKKYFKLVHRLIAEAFIPNPDNKPQVNHINGKKADNRILNIEWATRSENQQHAFDTGLNVAAKGEDHARCKLTEKIVLLIRQDNRSSRKIAKDYGITQTTILHIKSLRTWAHL